MTLRKGPLRLSLEGTGAVRFVESLEERRLIFGREQFNFFKIRTGVLIDYQRPDWKVEATPSAVSLSGKIFEGITLDQTVRLLSSALGFSRYMRFRNFGAQPTRIRMIYLRDPTSAQIRDQSYGWGALGVNASNRSSYVAMDEVADPPAARVIGSRPHASVFYLTADPSRAMPLSLTPERVTEDKSAPVLS